MLRSIHVVGAIALSMILQGCIGVGAWTLGTRAESSDQPHVDQTRGPINVHRKATEGALTTAPALRAQWGEPDRVVPGEGGNSEWIYKLDGFRWSGLVLYVVIIPLPAMVPVGSQYVSFLVRNDQIERATLTDWAFKAGVYCGFFGVMNGGWACEAGTVEEAQASASSSSK